MEKPLSAFLTHKKPVVRSWAKELLGAGETHGIVYDTYRYYKLPVGKNIFVVTLNLSSDPISLEVLEEEKICCAELDCSHARKARRLPKYLPYCEFLDIRDTEIGRLPEELPCCTHLWCDQSRVTELPADLSKCGWLACIGTSIAKLPALPACNSLSIQGSDISVLPELPSCKYLFITDTKISSFPELPVCEWIYCSSEIKEIPNLPNGTHLACSNTKIKALPAWSYESLDCRRTEVAELPDTFSNCETLYCSYTKIKTLPQMPKLKNLECKATRITDFSGIPSSCRVEK